MPCSHTRLAIAALAPPHTQFLPTSCALACLRHRSEGEEAVEEEGPAAVSPRDFVDNEEVRSCVAVQVCGGLASTDWRPQAVQPRLVWYLVAGPIGPPAALALVQSRLTDRALLPLPPACLAGADS